MADPTKTIRHGAEGLLAPVTPHFWVAEFDQPERHGQPHIDYPAEWVADRLRPLCEALELLRAQLGGHPIRVISGYRSSAYNEAVHGALDSQHLQGRAADIVVEGVSPTQVQLCAGDLHHRGRIRGLGIYTSFTHLDIRLGEPAIWIG